MVNLDKGKVKKANILFITDVFRGKGGSEKNIVNMLRGIDGNRFHIFVSCFSCGPISKAMETEGYPIKALRPKNIFSWNGLHNFFSLNRLIRRENISLIVTYHESSDIYGLLLSKLCHVPVISNRRDMGFKAEWKHKLFYRLFGSFFDANIVVSNAVRDEMVRKKYFLAHKLRCIYNGVDTNLFKRFQDGKKIRSQLGIRESSLVVGMVANLRSVKGIQYFVEAAAIINNEMGGVTFIIVGQDLREPGSTREDYEQLARELKVMDQIIFLGKRDDTEILLQAIDIGVLSSLSEGFSNVILEFMASGKPVVATDVGGNREAVLHGKCGFLVQPGDSAELAGRILILLKDKKMREEFGAAARVLVEEKFALKRMIEEYQEAFLTVISTTPRRRGCSQNISSR